MRIRAALTGLVMVMMVAFTPTKAEAQPSGGGPFGLGVILGDPTGITGKVFFSQDLALDFHLGVDGIGNRGYSDDVGLYADFLFHFELTSTSYFKLPLYVGPGLALTIFNGRDYCTKFRCYDDRDDDIGLAIRAPLGLSFLFTRFAGEAFIELPLNLWLVPFTDFDIDVALGFRYYF